MSPCQSIVLFAAFHCTGMLVMSSLCPGSQCGARKSNSLPSVSVSD